MENHISPEDWEKEKQKFRKQQELKHGLSASNEKLEQIKREFYSTHSNYDEMLYLTYSNEKDKKSGSSRLRLCFSFIFLALGVFWAIAFDSSNDYLFRLGGLIIPASFMLWAVMIFSWKGISKSAYVIDNTQKVIYRIDFNNLSERIANAAILIGGASLSISRGNRGGIIGTIGFILSVKNVFKARKLFGNENNLREIMNCVYAMGDSVIKMKDWKIISSNNRKTVIRGTVFEESIFLSRTLKQRKWVVYNVYNNYEHIQK